MPDFTVTLVADNEFIESRLVANVMILQRHPALQKLVSEIAALRAECGSCSGKKAAANEQIRKKWNEMRIYLTGLPATQRDEIKTAAKIKPNQRVRISYLVGSGTNTHALTKDF